MGISIVRFDQPDQPTQWGVVGREEIAVLKEAYPSYRELMDQCFADSGMLDTEGLERVSRNDVRLLSPVSNDVQIFCQGLNYASHRAEDEKRRSQLVKTQKSVRYLQPGDRLTLSLRSRDGSLDLGSQSHGVRDAAP